MLNDITQLLANPVMFKALLKLFLIYGVFMAFTGALPTPKPNANAFYVFVFRFFHLLSWNFNRAAMSLKLPGAGPQDDPKVS